MGWLQIQPIQGQPSGIQNKIELPLIRRKDGTWILLNQLGNAGIVRADRIDGPYQVTDSDTHGAREIKVAQASVHTSIKYRPKSWKIN